MKRSGPLKRRKRLSSSAALERGAPLRARPRRPMPAAEREAAEAFGRLPAGARCVVCRKSAKEAREAGTRLQAHHVIRQQTLRKHGLGALLWDVDNRAPVCEEPCHRRHTRAIARIPLSRLPAAALRFAAEVDLTHVLEREYAA